MNTNLSLAAFPCLTHEAAIKVAMAYAHREPLLGHLHTDHLQLVPQNRGQLTPEFAQSIAAAHPNTQFRLHANTHVTERRVFADLSGWTVYREFFSAAATVSKALKALAYSAHAGARAQATCIEVLDYARRASDLFGCPVAVEGHYPTPKENGKWLFSTWEEYRMLFDSGVPYALDLSHLNIVAHQSGTNEMQLVNEMLACERCIEVHLSDNDGNGDHHRVSGSAKPWWWSLTDSIHESAVVFTEGNHLSASTDH